MTTSKEKRDRKLRTPDLLTQEDFDRDEDPLLEHGRTGDQAPIEERDPPPELKFSKGYRSRRT